MSDLAGPHTSRFQRILPGVSLMLLAPLVAEVLPGATRFSVIHFVLPIQIAVWGGGAVMIRELVRRLNLGWVNLVLLALALALAEECLIQQTSLAPLVIQIKQQEYARAFGVNYVYLMWAIIYESAFVVFIPICLAELMFIRRRSQPWLSPVGAVIVAALFIPGCLLAWFSWTRIARPNVFHLPIYNPPLAQIAIAAAVILALIVLAIGPARSRRAVTPSSLRPTHPLVLALIGGFAAVGAFALEVLAFGIAQEFPPALAVAIGLALIAFLLWLIPRFSIHPAWSVRHTIGLIYGAIVTNLIVLFAAFLEASPLDFWGKVVLDVLALLMLSWLAARRWHIPADSPAAAKPAS
jgi:hypothetical protein